MRRPLKNENTRPGDVTCCEADWTALLEALI